MELYFNPYPDPAGTKEKGLERIMLAADAFSRLKKEFGKELTLHFSVIDSNLIPSHFVIARDEKSDLSIGSCLNEKKYKDKLVLLMSFLSMGRVIDAKDISQTEDWIPSVMDMPAPVLELAARKKAIAFTLPTEDKWRVDLLNFIDRPETLHNLWGQEDISAIKSHCFESLQNIQERFKIQYNAEFCPGALNSAPNYALWDNLGFFEAMKSAQEMDYKADDNLIKNIGGTKYGPMRELRIQRFKYRIFFVYQKGLSPEVLIGGFYKKGTGDEPSDKVHKPQNDAIKHAKNHINSYSRD